MSDARLAILQHAFASSNRLRVLAWQDRGPLVELATPDGCVAEQCVTWTSTTAGPRLEAFAAACCQWLDGADDTVVNEMFPHDVFLPALLELPELVTTQDFLGVLQDPVRREVTRARASLIHVLAPLAPPTDDADATMLWRLTADGRGEHRFSPATVRSFRSRLESGALLEHAVALLGVWCDEDYEPTDVAWPDGPGTTTLLMWGTFACIEHRLTGDLRATAIAAVNRLAQRPSQDDLRRAGFLNLAA